MYQQALRGTVPMRLLSVSLLLMHLMPGGSGQSVSRRGVPPGPFTSTAWLSSPGNQKCGGNSLALVVSPDRNYSLEHTLTCPNASAILCWAGVRYSSALGRGPLDTPLPPMVWRVSIKLNQQPTNSCTLRFTEDGDFQYGIGPWVDPTSMGNEVGKEPISVVWSSKTSGLGAVAIALQNNGILTLRDANSSVVWQSVEGSTNLPADSTNLPDSSSQANLLKLGYGYLAGILLFLVLYS